MKDNEVEKPKEENSKPHKEEQKKPQNPPKLFLEGMLKFFNKFKIKVSNLKVL